MTKIYGQKQIKGWLLVKILVTDIFADYSDKNDL